MTVRRFTIRDLLALTLAIALSLHTVMKAPCLAKAVSSLCDEAGKLAARIGTPPMGRDSLPPEW